MASFEEVEYVLNESNLRKVLYSPLKDKGFVPERGSEIFVSSIPEKATVYQLAKFFEQIGSLYQVKLKMHPDGSSHRGFAFVTFMKSDLAQKAIIDLKNTPFAGSKCLTLQMSVNNCRIFLGGIPTCKTKDEIWQQLLKVYKATNILDILTYRNPRNLNQNRGFVFLEFHTHEEAAHFRAKFHGKLVLFGKPVLVDWSVPVMDTEETDMSKVQIIFVRNLDINLSSEQFTQHIYSLISRNVIDKVYKRMHYAYIHLNTRQNAEKLMTILKRQYMYTPVEVSWAKPPNKFTDRNYRIQTLTNRRLQSLTYNTDSETYSHSSAAKPHPPPAIPTSSRHFSDLSFYSHPSSSSSSFMDWTDKIDSTASSPVDVSNPQNLFALFEVPILPRNLTPFNDIQPSYPQLSAVGSSSLPDDSPTSPQSGPSSSSSFSPVVSRPASSSADADILSRQLEVLMKELMLAETLN